VGLPVITLLGGLLVGYYQYINAYQEKVRVRAENDVTKATATFTEISKRFSEAHVLQQTMFFDFSNAHDDNTGADEKALAITHARDLVPAYERARAALLEAGDVMARSAEIYIDWATDFKRDPATRDFPNTDPVNRTLLEAYDFDCNQHLPKFMTTVTTRERKTNTCQLDGGNGVWHQVKLCPKNKTESDPELPVTIHWYSARHQVLTMHYCFHALHQRLAKVRYWASQAEANPAIKPASRSEREQIRKQIDNQAARLEAFMGLATFQIEAIREKYRPVSFACHIPFFMPLISERNDACTPIRTAPYLGFEKSGDSVPITPKASK
jgi:hypothetical protein